MRRAVCALLAAALLVSTARADMGVTSPAAQIGAETELGRATAVAFGSGTGDKATIAVPFSRYIVTRFLVGNCSVTPILAQPALYTAASAGGTNVVAGAVITGATSASVYLSMTLVSSTLSLTASTLYVNVVVANAAGLTCDVIVRGYAVTL